MLTNTLLLASKNLLKKAQEDQKDPYLALLDFRNTPMNEQVGSPAQQLMGRRTKTLLPTSANLLEPKTIRAKSVNRDIGKRQQKQKRYFDRHAKPLTPVSVGDDVLVQSDAGWKPAVITGIADAPRSYTLTTREGQTYRRNRKYIRKSHTAHDDSAHDDSDDDDNFPSTTQNAALKHMDSRILEMSHPDNESGLSISEMALTFWGSGLMPSSPRTWPM